MCRHKLNNTDKSWSHRHLLCLFQSLSLLAGRSLVYKQGLRSHSVWWKFYPAQTVV